MKKTLLLLLVFVGISIMTNAQYKKDGTPDMRYKANQSTYSTPSSSNTDIRYQSGYTRSDGTNVAPHYKTNNNDTNTDNFSTKGNYNSTTGTTGSRAKDYSSDALNYGSGHTIQTGSNGGQYYINSNGNKTYVPKR